MKNTLKLPDDQKLDVADIHALQAQLQKLKPNIAGALWSEIENTEGGG